MSEPSSSTPVSFDESPDFDAMSKTELLAYAVENSVEGVSSAMKKADILTAIKNA